MIHSQGMLLQRKGSVLRRSTEGAVRVALNGNLSDFHGKRIVAHDRIVERCADGEQDFDGLSGLYGTDYARQSAERACGNSLRMDFLFMKYASEAGGLSWLDGQGLSIKRTDAGMRV